MVSDTDGTYNVGFPTFTAASARIYGTLADRGTCSTVIMDMVDGRAKNSRQVEVIAFAYSGQLEDD